MHYCGGSGRGSRGLSARKCLEAGGVSALDAIVVTYSQNIFIPVTDLCRNRCGYCSFRREPKDAHLISQIRGLAPAGTRQQRRAAARRSSTMGESPWPVSGFQRLLAEAGVVGSHGLFGGALRACPGAWDCLPHTNAGLLAGGRSAASAAVQRLHGTDAGDHCLRCGPCQTRRERGPI